MTYLILEFLLRVDENMAQTDDEQVLLNLQFLEGQLQTFVDGYQFKGFYFPVKYNRKPRVINNSINPLSATLKEYKWTFKSWHLGRHLSHSQITRT